MSDCLAASLGPSYDHSWNTSARRIGVGPFLFAGCCLLLRSVVFVREPLRSSASTAADLGLTRK
jgi:hypothetical protein